MNIRSLLTSLVVGLVAPVYVFAEEVPASPPPDHATTDLSKLYGDAILKVKEMAGSPTIVGACDKKAEAYTTSVSVYLIEKIELFEVEHTGRRFYYVFDGRVPKAFVEERDGKFIPIRYPDIQNVLRDAGAIEFGKSIDPSEPTDDCISQKIK